MTVCFEISNKQTEDSLFIGNLKLIAVYLSHAGGHFSNLSN